MMVEDSLEGQLGCTGGVMSCYEYMDMPGIDWLGRRVESPVTPKQLGSVAAQLGKTRTLSESFAMCGWDVRFNELRWIAQWQFLNGVNTLCQHLSAYSLRGLRKRDYPASLHIQEPWFAEYRSLQDYFARTGAALEQGTDDTKVLLIQPLGNAAGYYTKANLTAIRALSDSFDRVTAQLSGRHLLHHYGDETILSRHGRVDDTALVVGKCRYEAVVIPPCDSLSASTAQLLTAFVKAGGRLIAIEKAPTLVEFCENEEFAAVMAQIPTVADAEQCVAMLSDLRHGRILSAEDEELRVHMAVRRLADGRYLYYLASLSPDALGQRTLKLPGKVGLHELDLQTEEERPVAGHFDGESTVFSLGFDEAESHLLLTVEEPESVPAASPVETLTFAPMWEIQSATDNAMTLDCCRYRIDGGPWQERIAVIMLQKKLLELRHPCRFELEFTFTVDGIAGVQDMALVMEEPERYSVTLNGCPVSFAGKQWFLDKSFRRSTPLTHLKDGNNTVLISGEFYQNPHIYELLFGENVHETELNKLTYDTELESLYLVGRFGVRNDAQAEETQRHALWVGRHFTVVPQTRSVLLANITPEGFWFFAGRMHLKQTVNVELCPGRQYVLAAAQLRVAAARVTVNGRNAGLLSLAPYRLDVTPYLQDGENTVEIELFTGCRNLLGPHHRSCGESYMVSPVTFTAEKDWSTDPAPYWRDDYCFVTTGVSLPVNAQSNL